MDHPARTPAPWHQENIRLRTVGNGEVRIDTQTIARTHWPRLLRDGVDVKRALACTVQTRDTKDFKRSAEIEHLDFVKMRIATFRVMIVFPSTFPAYIYDNMLPV